MLISAPGEGLGADLRTREGLGTVPLDRGAVLGTGVDLGPKRPTGQVSVETLWCEDCSVGACPGRGLPARYVPVPGRSDSENGGPWPT